MINLLSQQHKREIRSARINVVLLNYCMAVILLGVIVALIYAAGFWLVANDKRAIETKIASEQAQTASYADVQKQAEQFRKNLLVAKQILGSETSYSSFLTTTAQDLPAGAILTELSLGGPQTPAQIAAGIIIGARTSSYEKALETKTRLEQSKLYENVSIVNIKRPEDISKLTGQEGRYPYEASYNVKLSKLSGGTTR